MDVDTVGKINKKAFVEAVALKLGREPAEIELISDAIFAEIVEIVLKRYSVEVRGFGMFGPRWCPGQRAWNLATQEVGETEGRYVPFFKSSRGFRARLAQADASHERRQREEQEQAQGGQGRRKKKINIKRAAPPPDDPPKP